MTVKIAGPRKEISRRAALGVVGALAAAPALADECRIGPPPHAKGPLVWMDMDQLELDAAYDQSFYAPLLGQIIKRFASDSDGVRALSGGATAGVVWPNRGRETRHLPHKALKCADLRLRSWRRLAGRRG